MNHRYFVIHPIAPLRGRASDAAEMVSQLLFGDIVEVLEEDNQWRKIRNTADGYEGWVDEKSLVKVEEAWLASITAWNYLFVDGIRLEIKHPHGSEILPLSLGARIPQIGESANQELKIGDFVLPLPNDVQQARSLNSSQLLPISARYLGTPYLWGGKSLAGIDCSGFTQIVFAMCGFQLPRDAAQQAQIGQEVSFENRLPGDLAFFANKAGKITHVGIVLEGNQIRHASGNVHDDWLNSAGIQRKYTEKQTHSLVSIKRIF